MNTLLADTSTTVLLEGNALFAYMQSVVWASLRIGAAFMTAPILGSRALNTRIRLIVVLVISAVVVPWLPVMPVMAIDATTVLWVAREIAIGVIIGLLLRAAFEAGALAGELVAQGMGLSFAQMADPVNGGMTSGLVGQWFYLVLALIFFTSDGHLAFIELLVRSYTLLPLTSLQGNAYTFMSAPLQFFSVVLGFGVRLALPVILAMLVINIAFGVLSRTAPSLNPLQIGMPLALFGGILMLALMTAPMLGPVTELFETAFAAIATVMASQ